MTPPNPQNEAADRKDPARGPLDGEDAARQVAHVTGMTPDAARTFAAYHSGRYARFHG